MKTIPTGDLAKDLLETFTYLNKEKEFLKVGRKALHDYTHEGEGDHDVPGYVYNCYAAFYMRNDQFGKARNWWLKNIEK